MSEALNQVLERASTDEAFRTRLQSDPTNALAGYDLTPDERAALSSGDTEAMEALGVDPRVTKQYGSGPLDNPAVPGDAFPQGPFS